MRKMKSTLKGGGIMKPFGVKFLIRIVATSAPSTDQTELPNGQQDMDI